MQIKIGSIWGTVERKKFVVTEVKFENDETWVYYNSVETQVEYFCLEEAFKNRFFEIVNNG
jgi:hypothetical protein